MLELLTQRPQGPRFTLYCVALVVGCLVAGAGTVSQAATLPEAVGLALRRRGLEVEGLPVALGRRGLPWTCQGFLAVASTPGAMADVHHACVRVAPNGAVVSVQTLTNVTRSSGARETGLVRSGPYVGYAVSVGTRYDAVAVLDTRGEPRALTRGWPLPARLQNAIQNWQETGRARGFGSVRYQLQLAVEQVRLLPLPPAAFRVVMGAKEVILRGGHVTPGAGAEWVEPFPLQKALPGKITWLVDTVRRVPWIGPGPIEWMEHTVFGVKDRIERLVYRLAPKNTAAEVAEELHHPDAVRARAEDPTQDDIAATEIGWPPHALAPVLPTPVAGEGEWFAMRGDPFVGEQPNAPSAFVQTFLRADPEREFTRIYITAWDPRQVQLHLAMGTQEPESATGFTGSGMIPRDAETVQRLVGGFNGGFQALHGEYGMMADGYLFLPPKPWAATVAVMDDGQVRVGSWSAPPAGAKDYDEGWATEQIPQGMMAMRQNLTSVVEDGRWNPWERWWWGAAPPDATEQTYTARSGLCLTREGFMAFFWGTSMGAEALGRAMNAARCVRGMHLDMNGGHCGMEFYRTFTGGAVPPPLGRPLTEDEWEGPLSAAEGVRIRIRKAIKSMTMIRFPRYTKRDPRDFFYLTLKPVLPGPDLTDLPPPAGRFSSRGLPHDAWPFPFARAATGGTTFTRIDTRRALPSPLQRAGQTQLLATLGAGTAALPRGQEQRALSAQRHPTGWHLQVGHTASDDDTWIATGAPVSEATTRALGVDSQGFLVFVARDPADPVPMVRRLAQAGVTDALALPESAALVYPGTAEGVAHDWVRFYAEDHAPTAVLFPETRPAPYRVWGFIQGRRVRYFPQNPPRFAGPGGGN